MDKSVRELCVELMEEAEVAHVTTMDGEGFPRTRAMFNLRRRQYYPSLAIMFQQHDDDFLVYFVTDTLSNKVREISNNPKASVYYCLPGQWRGLTLVGNMELVEDLSIKGKLWQDDWDFYYPDKINDPNYSVICMRPLSATYYHELQHFEFDFKREMALV